MLEVTYSRGLPSSGLHPYLTAANLCISEKQGFKNVMLLELGAFPNTVSMSEKQSNWLLPRTQILVVFAFCTTSFVLISELWAYSLHNMYELYMQWDLGIRDTQGTVTDCSEVV